jgi:hypothetical protein
MEKILTIGDIHGKDVWKKLTLDTYDKVVFIGDYVDAFDISDDQMVNNLLDIIEFKKSNPHNIILLIGNHELNYFPKFGYKFYGRSSGFRPQLENVLKDIFAKNIRLFQYAYQLSDDVRTYLWTHAGVSNGWYHKVFKTQFDSINTVIEDSMNLADRMNLLFEERFDCMTQVGWKRGGQYKYGSPIWADKSEFLSTSIPLRGYYQIVGHNPVKDIKIHMVDNDATIVFTDCLGNKEKGYVIKVL